MSIVKCFFCTHLACDLLNSRILQVGEGPLLSCHTATTTADRLHPLASLTGQDTHKKPPVGPYIRLPRLGVVVPLVELHTHRRGQDGQTIRPGAEDERKDERNEERHSEKPRRVAKSKFNAICLFGFLRRDEPHIRTSHNIEPKQVVLILSSWIPVPGPGG